MAELGKLASGKFGGNSHYVIKIDSMQSGVERYYYWITRFLERSGLYGLGLSGDSGYVEKLKDLYAAGETSSYWGATEQKKALQEERAMQFLRFIADMTKALFQLIREMRIMDERLTHYIGYDEGDNDHSVVLKSIWVDMVEGGAKNPASVTGLSTQVGFIILPDLFYKIHPKTEKDVEDEIKKLEKEGINRKVREVLGRKLKQFLIWKEKTFKEINTRRKFMLAYLRQHYNSMKTYIDWLRPYLRNIKRLQQKDLTSDKDIIKAFETAKIELELLGVKKKYTVPTYYGFEETRTCKEYFSCISIKINYVTLPQIAFYQEQQRGAIHTGHTEIIIEGRYATKDEIEEYKKQQNEEDLELLTALHGSMEALKEELIKYLKEAEAEFIQEKMEELQPTKSILPFSSFFQGFKEMFKTAKREEKKEEKLTPKILAQELNAAKGSAKNESYAVYKVFKQAHGMLVE